MTDSVEKQVRDLMVTHMAYANTGAVAVYVETAPNITRYPVIVWEQNDASIATPRFLGADDHLMPVRLTVIGTTREQVDSVLEKLYVLWHNSTRREALRLKGAWVLPEARGSSYPAGSNTKFMGYADFIVRIRYTI